MGCVVTAKGLVRPSWRKAADIHTEPRSDLSAQDTGHELSRGERRGNQIRFSRGLTAAVSPNEVSIHEHVSAASVGINLENTLECGKEEYTQCSSRKK